MEAQAKMLADLIATVSSMNAKLDDLHPVVLELNQCRPGVERAADALRAEVGDLRARVVDTTHPAEPAAGTDMPPPFLLSADAPSSSSKPASASKQTSAAAATSGIDVCTRASPLDTNGCVAEVPAQACSNPYQDALSTSMGVTTVELLREQPPELVPMSAALRGYSSSATIVKETLGVDPSAATSFITMAHSTCSTVCLPRGNTEGPLLNQPPWPPPQIETIWLSCKGLQRQSELKPWPDELQHQCTGGDGPAMSSPFAALCDDWVLPSWDSGQQASVSCDQSSCSNQYTSCLPGYFLTNGQIQVTDACSTWQLFLSASSTSLLLAKFLVQWKPIATMNLGAQDCLLGNAGTKPIDTSFTAMSSCMLQLNFFLKKQHAQARVRYLYCSSSVLGWLSVDSGGLLIWGLTETAYRLPLEVPCSECPAPNLALANFAMVWQIAWSFICGGSSSDNIKLGGNEILIIRFCRGALLGLLGSAYNLFAGGTCVAHKVQNSMKFTSSNHLHEDTYIIGGHLNSPVVKRSPDASFDGGEDKELVRASPIWLVAWTVDDLEFSTGCILVCSPEHGLFPWHGQLRYLSSWIHVEYVVNIPNLTGRVAIGHRHRSDLDHYWSVLIMNERTEQYRDSVKILGRQLTQEGATLVTWLILHQTFEAIASSYVLSIPKHFTAPWDPGGGILQDFADSGLRASRMLRRGECHVPTATWAERWTGPLGQQFEHTRRAS